MSKQEGALVSSINRGHFALDDDHVWTGNHIWGGDELLIDGQWMYGRVEHLLKCYDDYYRIVDNGSAWPLLAGMKVRMEYAGCCTTPEEMEPHTMTRFSGVTSLLLWAGDKDASARRMPFRLSARR